MSALFNAMFNVCTLEQFYNKIYTANKYTNK